MAALNVCRSGNYKSVPCAKSSFLRCFSGSSLWKFQPVGLEILFGYAIIKRESLKLQGDNHTQWHDQ
jgi:hypothetical protein